MLADDEQLRETVIETVTVLESIEKEDVRGFRLASLLDPSVTDYAIQSRAVPFVLDAEQYQLLSLLIEQRVPHQQLLLPVRALSVEKISFRGVCYGTCKSSKPGDNNVIFLPFGASPTDLHLQKAGVIQTIFQYVYQSDGVEIKAFYLIVRQLLPMDTTNGWFDPYRDFSSRAFLCTRHISQLRVISLSQVVSHFALLDMRGDGQEALTLVWPVDRV